MDALCHGDVPLGIVPWGDGEQVFTLVMKVSYELFGRLSPMATQREPLGLDRLGPRGALTHPSDFSPYKHHCDVVLVGDDASRTDGQGTIVVGALEKRIVPGTSLGPVPTIGDRGNPSDPRLDMCWTRPGFDFELFQSAPRDQRLAWPTFPISVAYVRGSERVHTTIPSPGAQAMLMDGRGVAPPTEIALRPDLVALEPSRGLCHVTLRGTYVARGAHPTAPVVAVALGGVLFAYPASEIARWPRVRLIRPDDLAAPMRATHEEARGDETRRQSFERTIPLGATSPLHGRVARGADWEPLVDESTASSRHAQLPGEADALLPSLGRLPHAPELVRARPMAELFFEDPTTTLGVRSTLDAVTFVDSGPESEPTRSTLTGSAPTAEGERLAGVGRRAFETASSSLEAMLGRAGPAEAFSQERSRMARALGRRYATTAALREVAASVPALREAVDITTWGEI